MSILNFNNSSPVFTFEDTEEFEFTGLEELYTQNDENTVYQVNGLYVNENSKFGKSPLVVGDSAFINLPSHMVSTVEEIRGNKDIVEDINAGRVGFTIYEYHQQKYDRLCYSINWVELSPELEPIDNEDIPF